MTEEGQSKSTIVGDPNDGNITVTFKNNDMEAWGDFMPPLGQGAPITPDYISSLLEKLNILYGVKMDAIEEAALECNLNRKRIKEVLIAMGDPPVNEVTEYFELNPLLQERPLPWAGSSHPENEQIDYRAYSPFTIVKKDQALAAKRPRRIGREGKNVHGGVTPHEVLRPEGVSGGANTRTDDKYILSNINGQLIQSKGVLSVQNSLVIKGPVGYKTGNIIFPGDVAIDGPVSDGFKINSGGSVTIKQTFDVTEAFTRGDLAVAGGIIGRGRALVKVGGSLRTKFIENCRIACRKTIIVELEIINSSVFTLENVEMGDKGHILGGEIYAVHGIRTGMIGKKSGKATHIHCGIDFTVEQEKEKNNNILRLLAAKLNRLRELMADPAAQGEKRAKMEELLKRLEEEQQKAGAKVAELLGKINADEGAAVEVNGEIAPGTLIEICQVALFVTEPLKRVRVKLDREGGRLVTEALG
jgi:uncharacterized protein (DUF342 family)